MYGKSGLFIRFVKQTQAVPGDKSCLRSHSLSRKGEEDTFTNENHLYKCKYPLQKGNSSSGFRVAHPHPSECQLKKSLCQTGVFWSGLSFCTMLEVPKPPKVFERLPYSFLLHQPTSCPIIPQKEQSYSPLL